MGIQFFPSCMATPLWAAHFFGVTATDVTSLYGVVQSLEERLRVVGIAFEGYLLWIIVPLRECHAAGRGLQGESAAGCSREGEEREKNIGAHIGLCVEETGS